MAHKRYGDAWTHTHTHTHTYPCASSAPDSYCSVSYDLHKRVMELRTKDYFLSAHGYGKGSFVLPINVRVVMIGASGPMTACIENEFRVWKAVMREPFGIRLDILKLNYDVAQPADIDSRKHRMSVFSPDWMNGLCPNIVLSTEYEMFRSGLFSIPARFNRVYVADHRSKTNNNHLYPAGTIEPFPLNRSRTRDANIIRGRHAPNRLEQLLIRPFPAIDTQDLPENSRSRHEQEEKLASGLTNDDLALQMFANMASTGSVVVPDVSTYTSLMTFGSDPTLETIVKQLSVHAGPRVVVTVFVSACRTQEDGHSPVGIPLNDYVDKQRFNSKHTYADFDIQSFDNSLGDWSKHSKTPDTRRWKCNTLDRSSHRHDGGRGPSRSDDDRHPHKQKRRFRDRRGNYE